MQKQRTVLTELFARVKYLAVVFFALTLFFTTIFSYTRVRTDTPTRVHAATSSHLNFQARLYNANGSTVPDGYYNIEFKLYNHITSGEQAQGTCSANCLWSETRDFPATDDRVRTVNGYFSVNLGSVNTLPNIDWSQDLYLTMRIGGSGTSPTWETNEMSPRIKLTSVPYALSAGNLKSADTSTASTNSSNVSIQSGNATGTTSNSGNITLDVGTATGTTGTISIGTANTSSVSLGRVGITTVLQGTLQLSGLNCTTNTNGGALTTDASGNVSCSNDDGGAGGGSTLQQAYDTDVDDGNATIALTAADDSIVIQNPASGGTDSTFAFKIDQLATGAVEGLRIESAGSANVLTVRDTTATAADVFTIADGGAATFKSQTNSTTAFQIQNAAGATLVNVSTSTIPNLVANSSFEQNSNGWIAKGSATISASTEQALYGSQSLKVVTNTSSGNGATYRYSFAASTQYSFSFWARKDAGSAGSFDFGRIENGSQVETSCPTGQTLTTTWTQFTCTFTTGGTMGNTDGIYIEQTDTTSDNIYLDGITLVQSGTPQAFSAGGNQLQVEPLYSSITLNGNNSGALGAWQTNANALPGARQGHTSVVANGYVYVIGGDTTSTVYYAKLNADGSTGAWQTNANALPAARAYASAIAANGYVYAIGGSSSNTVYYAKLNADGSTGAWQTNANALPAVRQQHTSIVANGYAYVMGGQDGFYQSTVYYAKLNADGSTGAWQTNANALPGVRASHSSIVANGYVYVLGGTSSIGTNESTIFYARLNADGTTGAWSTNTTNPLPAPRTQGSSVAANGYVYLLGGSNAGVQSTVYYARLNADGTTGSWSTNSNTLTRARDLHSSVMANGYVYVIGGNFSGPQSTVFYASTSRIQLGGSLDLVGFGGQSLGDVGAAGTLTAGNTNIVGDLGVVGNATFAQGMSVDKELTVNGTALFKSQTPQTNAFQVQSSTSNTAAFNINTSTIYNLISNSNFETGTNGWSAKGASAISTDGTTAQFGSQNLKIVTTAATNDGAFYRYTLKPSTQYTFSLYARLASGSSSNISIGHQAVSGTDVNSCTSQSLTTTWTRYTCTFTTGGTITPPSQVFIKQSDAAIKTIHIDGVQLEEATTASTYNNQLVNLQVETLTNNLVLNGQNSGALGAWQTDTNALPAVRQLHSSVVSNGYVYVIGGHNNSFTTQSTVYYAKLNADGSTGAWQTNTNALPDTRSYHSSVATNGYIYVIGGANGSSVQSTVYYAKLNADGSTGAWQNSSNALPAIRQAHESVVANGYVYVLGGADNSGNSQSTVYYAKLNADGSTGAWQTNNNALPNNRGGHSSVAANGYVYVIGGSDSGFQSTVYYARLNQDGSIGSWSTNTANPLPAIRALHTSVISNGYVYVIGGDNASTSQSTVYYAKLNADGSTGAWQTNTNALPNIRSEHTSVVANGYVYVMGGDNASATQSTVFYASTSRLQIGGSVDLVGYGGQSLGDVGGAGQLTAGNTTIVGDLGVVGQATFAQGMSVDKEFVANGTALFKSQTPQPNAFQVQTSTGTSVVNISTVTQPNLITNSGFESATTGWANVLASTLTMTTTATAVKEGTQGLQAVTTATANRSFKYAYNFKPNTQYTFSIYAAVSTGTTGAFFELNHIENGSTLTTGCQTAQTLTTTLTRFTCTFTTGATIISGDGVGIRYTDATNAYTMYFDAAQLEYSASATDYRADPYPNLVANSNIESNSNGWSVKGSATSVASSNEFFQFGNGSLKIVTGTATNNGASYSYNFAPSSRYSLSFWARKDSGTASTFNIGRADNGSDTDCLTGQTINTTWTQFNCTFTTGATIGATSNFYIKQTDTASDNIYIDGVTLVASGSPLAYIPAASSLQVEPLYSNITLNGGNSGTLGTWQTNSNAITAIREYHTSVVANGYVYVIGGFNGGSAQSTVYYAKLNADGSTSSWQTNTNSIPQGIFAHSSVVTNGYVYVIGGFNGSAQSTVYYAKLNADGSTGSWQTNANALPSIRSYHSSAIANGYVYVMGGHDGSNRQSTVYYAKLNADGSTSSWQTNANALPSIRSAHSSVVANGYVYVLGGTNNGTTPQSTVYYSRLNADGSTGSWSTNTANPLPVALISHSSILANGYVYVMGGDINGGPTPQSTVYYAKLNADGSTGTWSTDVTLQGVRSFHSSVISNGYVYVIGGRNASAVQSTVYYASTSRIQLGGSLDLVGSGGQNLSEGGTGGSLTAGNTKVIGTLEVQDQASFATNVGIGGNLTVNGSTTIRNVQGSTDIFKVQNAGGVSLINTNTVNAVGNSSFETGTTNVDNGVDSWSKKLGTETSIKLQNSQAQFGTQSMEVITTTTTQQGVKSPVALKPSTQYTLSFYAKVSTGSFATLTYGRSDTGSGETDCVTNGSISTTFTRFTCTFTTGAGATGSSYIYISKGTDASVRTIYIDGVQLETAAAATDFRNGDLTVDAQTLFKSTSNSTTAFQIQNAAGNNYINVDTSGAILSLGNVGITSTIQIGNTTGNVAQTIGIGNNAMGSSTTSVTIGNLLGTSSTIIQGGTGASAIDIRAGSAGTINVGNSGVANTIQIGTTTGDVAQTVNIGNNNTASSTNTVNIGSNVGSSPVTIKAGTGNVNIGTSDTTGTLLVVDTKTDAGDPTGVNGGIYYNSNAGKFRCYQNGGWIDCAGSGGSNTLQGAYNGDTDGGDAIINLTSDDGGILVRDTSGGLGSSLFAIQNNGGTASYLGVTASAVTMQDAAGNSALMFDSTTSELRIYENVASPSAYARIYYAGGEAVFAASSGNTRVGSGSGNINLTLTGAADQLLASKTNTPGAAYSLSDFNFTRTITGAGNAITGNVLKVEDLSTFTGGGSVAPNLLYINQNNTSATGNLILAQTGGSSDKFKVTTAGDATLAGGVTIGSGSSYTGAGAVTYTGSSTVSLQSAAASSLTIDSGTTGALNIGTGANAKTITIGNATGATSTIVQAGTGDLTLIPITSDTTAFKLQDSGGQNFLVLDTTNDRLQVGDTAADGVGVLLVLDTKNDTGDPTGVNGAMYYNSNMGKFRCYENGGWKDCISPMVVLTKTADEVINSDATLNADSVLKFNTVANKSYHIRLRVQYNANNATADFKYRVTHAGTTTNVHRFIDRGAGNNAPIVNTVVRAFDAADVALTDTGFDTNIIYEDIWLQAGASGGEFAFEWAQNTSTGSSNTTVYEGSTLEYVEM